MVKTSPDGRDGILPDDAAPVCPELYRGLSGQVQCRVDATPHPGTCHAAYAGGELQAAWITVEESAAARQAEELWPKGWPKRGGDAYVAGLEAGLALPETLTLDLSHVCRVCGGIAARADDPLHPAGVWVHLAHHGLTPHRVKLHGRWHQCRIVRESDGRQCQGHEPHEDHIDAAGSPIRPGTGILWP